MPLPPAAAEARRWGGGYACRHCMHMGAGPVTRPLFAFHTWKSKLKGTVTLELHPAAWAERGGGGLPTLSPWSSLNWSVWVTAHSTDLAWGVDSLPASSRWSRRTATQLGPSLSPHGPQRRPVSHQSCRTGPGVANLPWALRSQVRQHQNKGEGRGGVHPALCPGRWEPSSGGGRHLLQPPTRRTDQLGP